MSVPKPGCPRPPPEHVRFLETFRRCLSELGYNRGDLVPRGDYTVAVFRSSREFTYPAIDAGPDDSSTAAGSGPAARSEGTQAGG